MSLHNISKQLAAKGRNGDSVLVHMTPGELHAMRRLAHAHGGELTINPETGLPEASFLKKWLPAILGMVAAPFTGGLSLGMTAAVMGGTAMATSLAVGNNLKQGLMDGLFAGAGGMLGGALGGVGKGLAAAAGAGVGETAAQGAVRAAGPAAFGPLVEQGAAQAASRFPGASVALGDAAQQALGAQSIQGAQGAAAQGLGRAGTLAEMQSAGAVPFQNAATGGRLAAMQQGLGHVTENIGNAGQFIRNNPFSTGAAALGLANKFGPNKTGGQTSPGEMYNYSYDAGYDPTGAGGYFFHPSFTQGPTQKLAEGGNIQYPQSQVPSNMYAAPNQMPVPREVIGAQDAGVNPYTGSANMAGGGLSSLGGYSDGGQLLRGPGDGVSDSIPATIEGRQPARLADGEFVVPARIVSELGNGSTPAGSKKLYAMMDRIKSARAGARDIAADTRADQHLPA